MRGSPTHLDSRGRPLRQWRRVGPIDLLPLIQERERQRALAGEGRAAQAYY